MIERVVVAGGGTGGHLFPGIALVEELRRRNPNIEVLFVGTARGIEARVLPERSEELALLDVKPLKGQGALKTLASLVRLPKSAGQAISLLRSFRPQLVVGLGGYASGPLLAAAVTLRLPTAVLEQNAYVGMTNRMLAKWVGRAYLTYSETVEVFGSKRSRVLGNPVRRDFVQVAKLSDLDPVGAEARAERILVIGGSQGARCLNELVPEALAGARVAQRGIEVTHQTGHAMLEEVRGRYESLGIKADVVPFIDDMARAYRSAKVVVGRAGASTLSELCAVGRPAILIPFPFAAADHQLKNARALEAKGAAVALPELSLTVEQLANTVERLLMDNAARRAMAQAARELGRPDAAAAIVDDLYEWIGGVSEDIVNTKPARLCEPQELPESSDVPVRHEMAATRRRRVRRSRLRVQPVDSRALLSGLQDAVS